MLQEKKPGNTIYANVDFYTAPVLADLGIPGDEFTSLFACGRIAGWTAHILEQLADNRLIRPQATYDGPPSRTVRADRAALRQRRSQLTLSETE